MEEGEKGEKEEELEEEEKKVENEKENMINCSCYRSAMLTIADVCVATCPDLFTCLATFLENSENINYVCTALTRF